MKVDIEELLKIRKREAEINCKNLKDIEFYCNGKKLEIPIELVEDFIFIGLNNSDFITSGFFVGQQETYGENDEIVETKEYNYPHKEEAEKLYDKYEQEIDEIVDAYDEERRK